MDMRSIATVTLALTLLGWASPGEALGARAAQGKDPLRLAMEAFEAGRFEQVLELAGDVPSESELKPRMSYLVGEVHYLRGDLLGAERAFREVLELRPEAVPAWIGLGRTLVRQGDHARAEVALRTALERAPQNVQALAGLALALDARGQAKEAQAAARQAYKLAREEGEAVRSLVLVLLRADEVAEAEAIASRHSRSRRKDPLGPFLLALVYERQGKDSRAITEYQQALARDERFLDAHKNLAILCHTLSNTYADRRRVDLAFQHYARYFELGGQDPELEKAYLTVKKVLRPEPGDAPKER